MLLEMEQLQLEMERFQHVVPSTWKASDLEKLVRLSEQLQPQSMVLGTTGRRDKTDETNVSESTKPDVWLELGSQKGGEHQF